MRVLCTGLAALSLGALISWEWIISGPSLPLLVVLVLCAVTAMVCTGLAAVLLLSKGTRRPPVK
jgi:hypothetical protein